MKRRAWKIAVCCLGLLLSTSFASADTLYPGDVVNADFTSLSSHVNYIVLSLDGETWGNSGYDHNVGGDGCWAGIHRWNIEDVASYYCSFCADMTLDPSYDPTPHVVSQYTGDIESIWGTYYDALFDGQDDAIQAAAMQLAIWEVMQETSGTYDISAGAFQLVEVLPDGGVDTAELAALTNSYLDSNTWTAATDLLLLTSAGFQPFFYPAAVPEPSSIVLLISLAVGGSLFAVIRTRGRNRA